MLLQAGSRIPGDWVQTKESLTHLQLREIETPQDLPELRKRKVNRKSSTQEPEKTSAEKEAQDRDRSVTWNANYRKLRGETAERASKGR